MTRRKTLSELRQEKKALRHERAAFILMNQHLDRVFGHLQRCVDRIERENIRTAAQMKRKGL